MNHEETFKSETLISFREFEHYKEIFEKRAVIEFLNNLPIEKLKSLVNFQLIDPRKRKAVNQYQHEENIYLMDKMCIKVNTNIKL